MQSPRSTAERAAPRSLKREYYDALRQLTLELAGIHLGRDHAFLVETRLAGLARTEGFPSLADMVDELFATGANRLAVRVVSALLERDTRFWVDRDGLEVLRDVAIPALRASVTGRRIRILSFGCASGQEAWSVAMMLHALKRKDKGLDARVVGVDYPSAALERAKAATYTHFEVQRGLPALDLLAHFQPVAGPVGENLGAEDWTVREHLRELVEFRDAHLLSRLDDLGQFDAVLFRGQLGRYSGPAQVRVLRGVTSLVREGGYLLLGSGERDESIGSGFRRAAPSLFQREIPVDAEPEPEPPKRTTFGPTG